MGQLHGSPSETTLSRSATPSGSFLATVRPTEAKRSPKVRTIRDPPATSTTTQQPFFFAPRRLELFLSFFPFTIPLCPRHKETRLTALQQQKKARAVVSWRAGCLTIIIASAPSSPQIGPHQQRPPPGSTIFGCRPAFTSNNRTTHARPRAHTHTKHWEWRLESTGFLFSCFLLARMGGIESKPNILFIIYFA